MFKFFRTIRHSLIMENKTSKYFKYAIGEIILVVIGILIALQINNWNKVRISRIVEQSILSNLQEDFNKNQQEIEVLIFANIKYERNLKKFIDILKSSPEKKIIEIADTLAMAAIAAPTYIPTTSTIDVIISTGNIDLIQNEELKTLISRFKREIADLSEDEIDKVINCIIGRIGHTYDLRNIIDLARYLFPMPPIPTHFRRRLLAVGSTNTTQAICSSLIAQAFQSTRYPILPEIVVQESNDPSCINCYKEMHYIRHYSLFTPRDFDVSPYFKIIKPTLEHGFDPHTLSWSE